MHRPHLTPEAVHSLVDAYLEMHEIAAEEAGMVEVEIGLPVVPRVVRAPRAPRCDVGSDIPGGGAA